MAANAARKPIQEGYGTENSPVYDDILATDGVGPPDFIRARGNYQPTKRNIPFGVYLDPAYAKLEYEHVWKKSWQFACREEEIPELGDCMPYDVGPLSFIIMRSGEDTFHAFYNSCKHKGTRLIDSRTKVRSIRCRFHGWQWNLNGSVKKILADWDFPDLDIKAYDLQQVAIDRWGGCLFINPDPNCGPLKDAMGVLPDHFKHIGMEERFIALHFRKKIRCNWKVLVEGFIESYHVPETHNQIAEFSGDTNARYDIFDDGKARIGRFMAPMCVSSPEYAGGPTIREACINMMKTFYSSLINSPDEFPDFDKLPDFGRKDVAAWKRDRDKKMFGVDQSHLSDTEMLDGIEYHMFPNFAPWLGEGFAVLYQFLPLGNDVNQSVFSARYMMPRAKGAARPPAPKPVELDFDDPFSMVPEWGAMCEVYSQDVATLPMVQRGMQSAYEGHAYSTLSQYQEQRCSALHEFLDEKINGG